MSCRCSVDRVLSYRSRISGPLLDRIDLQVDVLRPPIESLRPDAPPAESSAVVRSRVEPARRLQLQRQGCSNARLAGEALHDICNASRSAWQLLERAMDEFALSARAHQRMWRVARTIADLAGDAKVGRQAMAEALTLRTAGQRNR